MKPKSTSLARSSTPRRSLIEGPKELLTILWSIDPDDDEADLKYLTRTAAHSKKTVFHCEIIPVDENEKCPSPGG
jgi:hypothetical protein